MPMPRIELMTELLPEFMPPSTANMTTLFPLEKGSILASMLSMVGLRHAELANGW